MKKQTVEVKEFSINEVQIPIVGISPLIVHKFSEKARKQIEEKQAGKAQNKKHGCELLSICDLTIFDTPMCRLQHAAARL